MRPDPIDRMERAFKALNTPVKPPLGPNMAKFSKAKTKHERLLLMRSIMDSQSRRKRIYSKGPIPLKTVVTNGLIADHKQPQLGNRLLT